MSSPVQVGREATHGTIATTLYSAPVNFDIKNVVANLIPEEQRGGQDVHFTMIPGQKHATWSVKDSMVYHDSIGFFLDSAMGLPVSTVVETTAYDSVFKFLDDPSSLSFKYAQPRRIVQNYQALWATVDKMTFTFDAAGQLMWSGEGFAMPETEITAPTWTYSTAVPMTAWEGTVTLAGGAFTRLVKGSVAITRNRSPFRTINNSASPIDFAIGNRIVEFDLTMDFNSKTEYDRYKSGGTTDFLVMWEDADVTIGASSHPRLTLDIGTLGYEEGEIDTGESFPALNVKGKAIYTGADASSLVATVRSTRQYQTA